MDPTIYAYWDAEQIRGMLNAVAAMTSMDDYIGLMKVFAILGLFVAVATTFVKARGEEAAIYMIMLAVWYGGLFLPKKDVVIIDVTGGSGSFTVGNVPLGLAVFAGAESHIGYWLTKTIETVFAMPGDIKFEKTGFMFGARAIQDRQNVKFRDPNLVSSLANLTKDCIWPELNNDGVFYDKVMKTEDMWAEIKPQMNPGRLVQVYDQSTTSYKITGCDQAWDYLDEQLTSHIENDLLPALGRKLNPQAADSATAAALVQAQLPAADKYIFGVSRAAADTIKQAAMINLLADSTVFVPQMAGDTTSAQVALSTAMASAAANNSYRTMAKIGESSMPMIRGAIHIVILGLFPIVMMLIIMAGSKGGVVLRTYLMALLWVNLWAPVYAILNFFTSWQAADAAAAAVAGGNYLTFSTHAGMTHSMISDAGMAGALTLMVPVIAYMLTNVTASSFTSAITGIMSPASSAAQTAGSQVGTGNVSAGNTQWGNVTMHNQSSGNRQANNNTEDQWNTAPTNKHGAPADTQVMPGGATVTSTGGAPGVLNMGNALSNLGALGMSLGRNIATSAKTSSQNSANSSATFSALSGEQFASGLQQIKDFTSRASSGNRTGRGYGTGVDGNVNEAASRLQQATRNLAAKTGLTDKQSGELMAHAQMNVGTPGAANMVLPAKMEVALRSTGKSASEISSAYEAAKSMVSSDGFKKDSGMVYNYGTKLNTEAFQGADRTAAEGIKATLSSAQSADTAAKKEMGRANNYAEVAEKAETGQWGANFNPANEYVNSLGGDENAHRFLSTATPEMQMRSAGQFGRDMVERMVQDGAGAFGDGSGRNAGLMGEAGAAAGAPPSTAGDLNQQAAADRNAVQGNHTANLGKVPGRPGAPAGVSSAKTVQESAKAGLADVDGRVDKGEKAVDDQKKPVEDAVRDNMKGAQRTGGTGARAVANATPGAEFDPVGSNPANPAPPPKKPTNTGGSTGKW